MPRPKISLLPDTLDLAFYGGDGVDIQLTVTDTAGAPIPLTGTVIAQIRITKLDASPSATFSVDLAQGSMGIAAISLTGVQTAALTENANLFRGLWDVQWDPDDREPVTLVQGRVECYADISR